MADYIERGAMHKQADYITDNFWKLAIHGHIDRVPASDVRPVVRCADCKHWFDNGTDLCSCDMDALLRHRDFFCANWEKSGR